jgi:hypothetical protein
MSIVATLKQQFRAPYPNQHDKNEQRPSTYGAFNTFMADTMSSQSILTESVRSLVGQSFGNTVAIPVLKHKDVTITNVRSCTITPDENTSALVTLTFVTYSAGFQMTPSQHFNNEIDYFADFERKYVALDQAMAKTIDSACYNKMNTDRNQVWNSDITALYATTGNALQVNPSQQDVFYNNIPALMETMDFNGPYNVVASTMHKPFLSFTSAQGSANSTNLGFQFQGFNWNTSNRVLASAGSLSTTFISQLGTYGIINRNDPDSLAGIPTTDGTQFGLDVLPSLGMTVGYKYSSTCADQSSLQAGTTGLTATRVESFQWTTDVCYITAYNSAPTTRANPIIKADFLAAEA